ncbi:MAG: nucleotidyltransferase domain-containing protein [Microgenomates group bacterium]
MPNLYSINAQIEKKDLDLSPEEISSIYYHDIFDYPLNLSDLIRWKGGEKNIQSNIGKSVSFSKGFYFVEGKEGSVYKRLLRNRVSEKKIQIAKKVSKILSLIPLIKMVGITGSLAMKNADENGDIDLLVVTKKGSLWTTRAIVLTLFKLLNVPTRRFGDKNQKDKICLNMWMDESDLIWKSYDRNSYTAHEIAQIIPIVNKNKTFEHFLDKNRWILNFWPKAVRIKNSRVLKEQRSFLHFLESFLFQLQYSYMKKKISREVVKKTRAFFHPQNWSKFVVGRLTP